VAGPNAEQYHFTSSLPVQIVKFLEPTLSPLVNRTSNNPGSVPVPKMAMADKNNVTATPTQP
jgi:hypothetical protein